MAYMVLATKRYNFRDNDTGNMISGCKITYCDEPTYEDDSKGMQPMTITAPLDSYKDFTHVPGLYDIEFTLKPGAKGQAQLVYKTAKFVKKVDLPFGVTN